MPDAIGNNWGWQLGPIEAGTNQTFNLHAGAGQCNTDAGYVAGTVTVNYDGTDLTVDVNVDSVDDELGAVQVYAEYAVQCTTAPGQYTILGNSGVRDDRASGTTLVTPRATRSVRAASTAAQSTSAPTPRSARTRIRVNN
jgi:hypothetical protein